MRRNPFDIERGGVRITSINSDPDGMPSYDRSFLFRGNGELSIRDAWAIARFITRHTIRAEALQAYKRLRRTIGLNTRPNDQDWIGYTHPIADRLRRVARKFGLE
jgi:hypothetical protein